MQRWLPALLRRAGAASGGGSPSRRWLSASSSLLFDDTQEQVTHTAPAPAPPRRFPIPPPRALADPRFFGCFFPHQFKESVHRFAQEHIAPHAAAIDASNYFPKVRHGQGCEFATIHAVWLSVRAPVLINLVSTWGVQEVNLWKLMGDFNLHGLTSPGRISPCIL
jgi:isovaleryl-CoA dehydrogenase